MKLKPRTEGQALYLETVRTFPITLCCGPAGSGKTLLAVGAALEALAVNQVNRIVLCRPVVEAGERLGFLPGDRNDKVEPYLQPLFDSLNEFLTPEEYKELTAAKKIEIAQLGLLRGRTFKRAFVILDEAQNTTAQQMLMFLTRFGSGSRFVVVGDPTQNDLPRGVKNGLAVAVDALSGNSKFGITHLSRKDIVRDPLVAEIIDGFDRLRSV